MATTTDRHGAGLTHDRAMQLQRIELDRTIALLESLSPGDWAARTDCPDWDVHHMYLHVLGACEAAVSMREQLHQMVGAKRHQRAHGGPLEAGLSSTQVADREQLDPGQLVARLRAVAPRTIARRSSLPALLRRAVRMQVDGPVVERWSLGYLVDTIYLRDLWLHRVDACRATGRELQLDAGHDGVVIADVVAEWARRHGQPYRLRLSGPAGGDFESHGPAGSGAAELVELDAVEFCRTVGGRSVGRGLLATVVPF